MCRTAVFFLTIRPTVLPRTKNSIRLDERQVVDLCVRFLPEVLFLSCSLHLLRLCTISSIFCFNARNSTSNNPVQPSRSAHFSPVPTANSRASLGNSTRSFISYLLQRGIPPQRRFLPKHISRFFCPKSDRNVHGTSTPRDCDTRTS